MFWWFFVIAALAVPLQLYVVHQRRRGREATARRVASAAGLRVSAGDKRRPRVGFDHFDVGSDRTVSLHMWQAYTSDGVFRYEYTVDSGKHSKTHVSTCAMVETSFDAPQLRIGPESFFAGLGRLVGVRDIEIESPEFNDRYRVRCDDERFAIAFLDHEMIAWMLTPASGAGTIRFELLGSSMLCVSDELTVESMPAFLRWAQQVCDRIPAVIPELYPR